jgi:hypothetical protein
VQADPIAGELHGLQRPTTASPAWQQASSVWIIVGNDGASGDDSVFALTPLSSGCWRCSVVVWSLVVVLFFLLFSELSFGLVWFVSMSQSDRQELLIFLFPLLSFFRRGCWSLLYRCAYFGFIFFLIYCLAGCFFG